LYLVLKKYFYFHLNSLLVDFVIKKNKAIVFVFSFLTYWPTGY